MKINDIEKKHKPGSHCLTTALATIFRYQGIELSEDMLLGLGSGLGFTYVRQSPQYLYGGRSGNLEKNIGNALGLNITTYKSDNFEIAWNHEKEMINKGYPVICESNINYLPYLADKMDFHENSFGGHKFLLIGYDEIKDEVYLLDYLWKNHITMRIEDFKKSQNAEIYGYDNKNATIVIEFPHAIFPIEYAIVDAIRFNVQQMKHPVAYGLGLKSLKRFSKEIFQWPRILSETRLRQELYMAYIIFEKTGTGGGNFRRMYSRFLRECSNIFGEEVYLNASLVYAELGRRWKAFSKKLYSASQSIKLYDLFMDKIFHEELQKIIALENEGIALLENI